ncbi:hypothetical protein BST13_35500 [Mycobacterium aquaticum]|uniref:Pyrrolo-quinoline quinone repeat domain-containing protein n=1 Tax=Mycobacterium aquaticum TaxID=1927124 RepID=A0A1W9ZZS0_9MYCO|nr:hypothetical protein BST13_35500 [Mycobacterium aquaticum]
MTAGSQTPQRRSTPRSFVLVGVTVGLMVAAALCLVVAWRRLNASSFPGEEPGALVYRTTVVVVLAAVIVVAYLGLGRLYRRSTDRMARFLAATSSVPAAVAVGGLIALHRGTSAELFRAVAYAQSQSNGPVLTAAAREAWWLACLAVAAVALRAAVGHLSPPASAERMFTWSSDHIASMVLATAMASVLVVPVVLAGSNSPPHPVGPTLSVAQQAHTADRVEPEPIPSNVVGEVAYRVEGVPYDARVAAAGPGFVTVVDGDDKTSSRLIGYDGATGRQRWFYQFADPKITSWTVTGTGAASVVVVSASHAVLGFDATTGELLWHHDRDRTDEVWLQASTAVVLATQSGPSSTVRTALAARTGETLWTDATPEVCGGRWLLGEDAVLVPACDPGQPDVAARLMDPHTGRQRGEVRLPALGIDADELRRTFGDVSVKETHGSTGLLEIRRVQPTLTHNYVAVDLQTGGLLATAPPDHDGYLLDSRSMVLFGAGDTKSGWAGSILDVHSGVTVPIGLYTRGTGDWDVHPQVISIGAGWVTSLSTLTEADKKPGEPSMSPLRALDSTGALRILPSPCAPESEPALGALAPGALLARCGDQVVGVR